MRFDIQVRRNNQVIDHGVEEIVHAPGRSQQATLFEPYHHVVFRLAFPDSLAFERREVLGDDMILDLRAGLDQDLGEFVEFVGGSRRGVTPDARLRLETRNRGTAAHGGPLLFDINLGRHP